jgi:ADP-ribose pyrophosphatase YjhB (NUDIX family)/acetyltransferase-like isoleucine patch superfamily enzyme
MNKGPAPTVDVIVEIGDQIVLIERKNPPFGWALPGGFVDYGETVEAAATREILEETSLQLRELKQFKVFSSPDRDPRQHTITTVFIARGEGEPRAADDARSVGLFRPSELPSPMAFDHLKIIEEYLQNNDGSRGAALLGARKASLQGQLLDPRGNFGKYRDIFVGRKGLWQFLKYECLTTLLSPLGGAGGLFLRKMLFKRLLKKTGRGVVFGKNVTLRHPHKIEIGDNVFIDDYVVLDAKGEDNNGIRIGNNCFIGRNTVLSCKEGDIRLDDFTSISNNCSLLSESVIAIGPYSYIAGHCFLVAGGNHKYDRLDVPILLQDADNKGGIVLEGNNWLGAGVQVLDGAIIGYGTIIGAGSTVYKRMDRNSIAVGIPALVTKRRT